jgi:calcineurin-like phosphoesterase family protein
MSTFLTADTHFGHASIIRNCNRPFADVAEMDDALIERWNAVVHPRDVIWHLGDFGYGDEARIAKIFHALNGTKKLILGNHDLDDKGRVSKAIDRLPWASVSHAAEIKHDGQRISLSHYAGLTWSAEHHGAYQAFGHSHGRLLGLPGSVDVGVDAQNYAPISVEEFVRQADETIEHAEERILQIVDVLLAKAPRYAERDGGAKFRARQAGRKVQP